jgi:dTDP-4-amino-4,6-dideoxygalactose transaminase
LKIYQNVLDRQFQMYQQEYEQKALDVLRSGWYVLGNEVKQFEEEFAGYIGTKYCVGLASGLDALWIAFRLLGIGEGDEVIVQGNAYIACVMGITINGATPVFVEPDCYYNIDVDKIEEKITKKTKAILAVHLYGQASRLDRLSELCKNHHIFLVEDCAQSHGACYNNQMTGTFGDIGCFSFYPSKNLGSFGEGGAIVTNNEEIARMCRVFRNYGSEKRYHNMVVGTNSRLQELQAGLLRVKLSHLNELNAERKQIVDRYLNEIVNPYIILPKVAPHATSVWHLFVAFSEYRDMLIKYLEKNEIYTVVHYPIPPHLSQAYEYLGLNKGCLPITEKYADCVLSLPLFNGMKDDEIERVIEVFNAFSF